MKKVRFTSKSHPVSAIIAAVIGAVAIVIVTVMIVLSVKAGGNAGIFIGAGGTAAMLLCIIGAIIGVRSFLKEDVYYLFPIIATSLNGVTMLALFVIYAMGVMA